MKRNALLCGVEKDDATSTADIIPFRPFLSLRVDARDWLGHFYLIMKDLEQKSSAVSVFENTEFGSIRTAGTKDEPLFCLVDVCRALGLDNPGNVVSRLDGRGFHSMDAPTYNQHGAEVMQKMHFINEPNLYRCIFQSRKPNALKFQDWVYEEVLPSIRRTGKYETNKIDLSFLDDIKRQVDELGIRKVSGVKVLDDQRELFPYLFEFLGNDIELLSAFTDIAPSVGELRKKFKKFLDDKGVKCNNIKCIDSFLRAIGVPFQKTKSIRAKYYININL